MELQLNDLMPIGKFKGFPIEQLLLGDDVSFISSQHKYLKWFDETVKEYTFSLEVKKLLKKRLIQIADDAWESNRDAKERKRENDRPSSNKRKQSYTNENSWQSGINESYQEAGMSLGDMGYTGDGF